MHRPLIAALLPLVLALGLAGCGDDEDDGGGGPTRADAIERYCRLSAELENAGEDIFRELEADPQATQEDFRRAEAEFVRRYEDELNAIAEAAPAEIAEDAAVLTETVRARAGLTEEPPDEQAAAKAERAINRFEKENCPK
jgi:hypothetical protein